MYEHGHERLEVFRLAVEVADWAVLVHVPAYRRHLREQLARAVDSIVLNIAEGAGQPPGAAKRNHYRIALGSTGEVGAIVLLLKPVGGEERQQQLRRIGAMLSKLSRG